MSPRTKNETPDGSIAFISHDENDLLLWLDKPEGPFDSTQKTWNLCIDKLIRRGFVKRTGDGLGDVKVTRAGRAHATELRGAH